MNNVAGKLYFGYTVDDVYIKALTDLKEAREQPGRDQKTKEMLHIQFRIEHPHNRLVSIRDINPAFAFVEVLWIMAGGNNVKYLEFWNLRMKTFAQPDGSLYGAYGARLGNQNLWEDMDDIETLSPFTGYLESALYHRSKAGNPVCQLGDAYHALRNNGTSRQIVLEIWNDWSDLPLKDGQPRAFDVPCNLMSHLTIREGKLEWLQVMRSNDAIWGFPYNVIQWTFIQEIIAGWLGVIPGGFTLLSDSFHTYERHWDNLDVILNRPPTALSYDTNLDLDYEEWKRVFEILIRETYELTQCKPEMEEDIVNRAIGNGLSGYESLLWMLAAEALRIKGKHDEAIDLATTYMYDNYWLMSWVRWAEAKYKGVII